MTFIRLQVKAGSWMLPTRALPAWARTLTRSLLEVNGGHCPEWWVHKVTGARAFEVPMCPRHLADTFHLAAYHRRDLVELRAYRIPEPVAS